MPKISFEFLFVINLKYKTHSKRLRIHSPCSMLPHVVLVRMQIKGFHVHAKQKVDVAWNRKSVGFSFGLCVCVHRNIVSHTEWDEKAACVVARISIPSLQPRMLSFVNIVIFNRLFCVTEEKWFLNSVNESNLFCWWKTNQWPISERIAKDQKRESIKRYFHTIRRITKIQSRKQNDLFSIESFGSL